MNDIAKQNVQEKLEKALTKEVLTVKRGAELLGITATQVSCIKNPKLWRNVGDIHWGSVLAWVNSGQTLVEWSEKHGKVLSEKKDISAEVGIPTLSELRENAKEKPSTPELTDFNPQLARFAKKIAEGSPRSLNRDERFFALLIEAKASLIKEIDPVIAEKLNAIDVLLKYYI